MAGARVHTVKKGESLDKIAKSYGFKSFKEIYNDPVNAKFRKTRPDPKLIQPGDQIVLPDPQMPADQRKSLSALIRALEADLATMEKAAAEHQAFSKKLRNEVNSCKNKVKNVANGVDAAALIIGLVTSLGKITVAGYKATTASAKVTAKLNKEALKELGKMHVDMVSPAIQKGAQSAAQNSMKVVSAAGVLVDSFYNMTSPSFWAKTIVKADENGMLRKIGSGKFGEGWDAWSKAVTWDPMEEFDAVNRQLTAQSAKIAKAQARGIENRKALIDALKKIEAQ